MPAYLRPASQFEALAALAQGRLTVLAGGTDYYPSKVGKPLADDILDISRIEAGRRSGALITADFGLELGRPVLAVPGWPGSVASEGCNGLLRAGAGLLEEAADVVFEIPRAPWRKETPAAAGAVLEGLAGAIHELLQREPMGADRLAAELGEGPAEVAGALALLEVEGLVVRGEAQRFWAAPAPRGRRSA